jgi:hypothetical protein
MIWQLVLERIVNLQYVCDFKSGISGVFGNRCLGGISEMSLLPLWR